MRIFPLLLSVILGFTGAGRTWAQDYASPPATRDPGAQQDAEEAREKLLKASDELDNIQANSEATKVAVDGMKDDVTKLQSDVSQLQNDNATLHQQLAATQAELEQTKADEAKARQELIDKVADLLAQHESESKSHKKSLSETEPSTAPGGTSASSSSIAPNLAPPPDPGSTSADNADATPPAPKPQKGYYHMVADGETLSMICAAYRDSGVEVTVSEVRKANGLKPGTILKPGQKLFIPKPVAD